MRPLARLRLIPVLERFQQLVCQLGREARPARVEIVQLLAVALTYLSVVATDGSLIVREVIRRGGAARQEIAATIADTTVQAASDSALTPGDASADATPGSARTPAAAVAMMLGFLFIAPVMIGFSSPLHLLIVGFALYEAWKLNRTPVFAISGPHRLATPAP